MVKISSDPAGHPGSNGQADSLPKPPGIGYMGIDGRGPDAISLGNSWISLVPVPLPAGGGIFIPLRRHKRRLPRAGFENSLSSPLHLRSFMPG